MNDRIDASTLHRTAKLFMDDSTAATAEAAMARLRGFGLNVLVGPEIATSAAAQVALLTLFNVARRTFLSGVEVVGLPNAPALVLMAPSSLKDAVVSLGGTLAEALRPDVPLAVIGANAVAADDVPTLRLTWQGWNGGVVPVRDGARLQEDSDSALAPALAAAICTAEIFAWHAGERTTAGRRTAGLSLWDPSADWLVPDPGAPSLTYLPSRLWLIGLGNLGQAFAWALATLPYAAGHDIRLVLQDDDVIAPSNDSTSLLSDPSTVGQRKTRVVAAWLEARGFATVIEERRFGPWIARSGEEPAAAFCGVDNPFARSALEDAGFGLVVEAGLGGGSQAFRSLSVHAFPGSKTAKAIWPSTDADQGEPVHLGPAYAALERDGMDACGLAQLASRTVGVPFVGLSAACLALAEFLRRLNGGGGRDVVAGSLRSLGDIEVVAAENPTPFTFGFVEARRRGTGSGSAVQA